MHHNSIDIFFPLYREPQSLFNRPEHVSKYKDIASLKYSVDNAALENYVQDFDNQIKDDTLMIANVSLDEIQVWSQSIGVSSYK